MDWPNSRPSTAMRVCPIIADMTLAPDMAARFAGIALGHVGREYPNKPEHTLAGPEDAGTPAALHPVFYGSYDWHSCVHGYWMLARLLRRHPGLPQAEAVINMKEMDSNAIYSI